MEKYGTLCWMPLIHMFCVVHGATFNIQVLAPEMRTSSEEIIARKLDFVWRLCLAAFAGRILGWQSLARSG